MVKIIFQQSPFKKLSLWYFLLVFLFTCIYCLPISADRSIPFIDALFLSSSALSTTGLTTVDLSERLTLFGQITAILEMQIGGVGIMALIGFILLLMHRDVSLPQLTLMGFEQNQISLKSVKKMVIFIIIFSLAVETIGLLLLFPAIHQEYKTFSDALLKSIFQSVSSFTHSSLDLFGGNVFRFSRRPFFLIPTSMLIILGGIGFPTVWELLILRKRKKSLYTKVNLIVHGLLLFTGTALLLLTEWSNTLAPFAFTDKLINAFFLSAGSRNSGFANVDISKLSPSSLLLIMMLMFIGGSSSSSAGGIRTTTFAILVAKAKRAFQGKADIVLFKTSLYEEDVQKAYLVFFLFLSMYLLSVFGILTIEQKPMQAILFEVMSAITNTGFSTGITNDLSVISKIGLVFLMMVGRIGIISIIYSILQPKKSAIKYRKESIIVG